MNDNSNPKTSFLFLRQLFRQFFAERTDGNFCLLYGIAACAALQNHAAFLNASDFAAPSVTDREHMDEKGHAALADAIYNKILALQKGLSHVI